MLTVTLGGDLVVRFRVRGLMARCQGGLGLGLEEVFVFRTRVRVRVRGLMARRQGADSHHVDICINGLLRNFPVG